LYQCHCQHRFRRIRSLPYANRGIESWRRDLVVVSHFLVLGRRRV
jgi:hypothetical protein